MGEQMTRSPREMSTQEAQERLAESFLHLAEYWRDVEDAEGGGPRGLAERVDGIGHSILTLIDGYSGAMCGLACANKETVDSGGQESSAARLDRGLLAAMATACGREALSDLAVEFGSAPGRLELIAERDSAMSMEIFEFMGRLRAAAIRWGDWRGDGGEDLNAKACEGFAMSACALMEGRCAGFAGFAMAAMPHEDDKEHRQSSGEDWFPELADDDPVSACDLAGSSRSWWSRCWGAHGQNASALRAMLASLEEAKTLEHAVSSAGLKKSVGGARI